MAIPTVPDQNPNQDQITIQRDISPYSLAWWTSQIITDIPADSVGWLVSQGWQITNVIYDTTTQPNTPSYTMTRESLQNWIVLQNLLNSYTIARNNAQTANELRYNQVVANWTEMLDSSQEQFEAQTTEQNANVTLYLANLDTYMTSVDSLINSNLSQVATGADAATTAIADLDSTVDLLSPDYDAHVTPATDFLDGLGATELARINEQFAASLATQLQQLVDRGLYSSAMATAVTARNTRDKNEALGTLNDRLNREKWENQHRLFEQQAAMRSRVMTGKERVSAMTMQNASTLAEHQHRAIVEKMNAAVTRLEGLRGRNAENMDLMRYQLDARNNLLVGLYGFVERREDIGPAWEEFGKLVAGLGDSAGGWLTP